MNESEKLIYVKAINDARELLIANGNKVYDEGDKARGKVIAECSQLIATLIDEI